MALDQGITDSVTLANTKVYGDTMATLQGLAIQNAISANAVSTQNMLSHQHTINQLTVTILAKAVNKISDPQIENAAAVEKEASAGLPEAVQAMLGALNAGQIGTKSAQSTAPETAVPSTVVAGK